MVVEVRPNYDTEFAAWTCCGKQGIRFADEA
jgi:hypothetical protein